MKIRSRPERTITERVGKRIRRGQKWGISIVPDATIVKWANQYGDPNGYEELMKFAKLYEKG